MLDALRLPNDVRDIVACLAAEAAEAVPAGENEQAWEGVQIQDVYYAWAGPLLNLQDRGAVPPSPNLLQEIGGARSAPRWGNHDRLAHNVQRGFTSLCHSTGMMVGDIRSE